MTFFLRITFLRILGQRVQVVVASSLSYGDPGLELPLRPLTAGYISRSSRVEIVGHFSFVTGQLVASGQFVLLNLSSFCLDYLFFILFMWSP